MSVIINTVKQKLDSGAAVIGTAVTTPSPQLMRMLIECGFDWLMIDLEHGPIGPESMQAMINATHGSDCMPFVRLPGGEKWMAKMPLDCGATGLFFPLISDAGVIMIEHIDAVDQLEEIIQVDGIDLIFIAPYDLSQSLGLPGKFDHPRVLNTIKPAEQMVKSAGIKLGGYAGTVSDGRELLDRGYDLVMLGYDGKLVEDGIRPLVNGLRE